MNKFYLINNSKLNLEYVSSILNLCNGEQGILASIFNCIFQDLMLEGNKKYVVHRKILNKIVNSKSNVYKALHKILRELGVKEFIFEGLGIELVEKCVCKEEKLSECLKFNVSLQSEILNSLIKVINLCGSSEQLKILNIIYEIEKNNNDLLLGLCNIKTSKKDSYK